MREGEGEIKNTQLRAFQYAGDVIEIKIEFSELTWKCKISGCPDFAVLTIIYNPKGMIIDLKSLKLWLNAYRDKYYGYEVLINEIFATIWKQAKPKFLEIQMRFNPRGNVLTEIKMNRGKRPG